jgi:hypothetical protein
VLGPFLFLIYINDIVDDLDCNIKLFADDTSLYVIVDEQNYIQAAGKGPTLTLGEPQHQFPPTQMRIHLRPLFVSYHLNNL